MARGEMIRDTVLGWLMAEHKELRARITLLWNANYDENDIFHRLVEDVDKILQGEEEYRDSLNHRSLVYVFSPAIYRVDAEDITYHLVGLIIDDLIESED